MILNCIFTLLIFLIVLIKPAQAVFDPLSVPNNKFGIHIIDENDLDSAAHLVNSSGGDWGYVTMVIPENDRNYNKWSNTFRKMGQLHLIPIVRLATRLNGDFWEEPGINEADVWAEFLNSLPWPVKNRYVIIYNEPNHAKEWGNSLDPSYFAEILMHFSGTLKERSEDFFILPAGLDSSAPNSLITMDEVKFLKTMLLTNPQIFDYIDGWASHSYPNPHFSGRVTAKGRGTLSNFVWELNLLKTLGLERDLPVFITETGWMHSQDEINYGYLSPETVAQNYLDAGSLVWNKEFIVAVSPFLLNYQGLPFNNFSWQKMNSSKFYPQYDAYRSILKNKGEPILNTPTPTITPAITYALIKGDSDENPGNVSFLTSLLEFFKKIIITFT